MSGSPTSLSIASVSASKTKFHGLLLGHRHRLRPQADQGFRVSAADLHDLNFRNGFNGAK
jgi:hypothetical protein